MLAKAKKKAAAAAEAAQRQAGKMRRFSREDGVDGDDAERDDKGRDYDHDGTEQEQQEQRDGADKEDASEEKKSISDKLKSGATQAASLSSKLAKQAAVKTAAYANDVNESDAMKKAKAKTSKIAEHVVQKGKAEAKHVQKVAISAAKTAQSSDLGHKTAEYANMAKSRASDVAKKTKEAIRQKALEMASVAATKVVNKAIDSVSTSMGRDPYMPSPVLHAVDSMLNDVKGDAEIMLREALEDLIAGTNKEAVKKITATYKPCCQPNPLSWFRAVMLYTMAPNDRSIWWQLRQPAWWFFTAISIFPLYGVAQVWWVLLFFFRDFRDEYQLVNFMITVKTVAVISVGLLPSYIGISTYISCTERGTCNTEGPGVGSGSGTFIFQTVFLCIQASLVYLAALLIPCSTDKGRMRIKQTSTTSSTIQAGDERGQRRLMAWIIYDILTCAMVAGLFVLAWLDYRETSKSANPFRDSFSEKHPTLGVNETLVDLKDVESLNATALEYASKLDSAIVVANALFLARVYWLRVLYGLLCLPWWVLKLPLMSSLLLHTHPTAYNRRGETVPFATQKEKDDSYNHRCFKCHDDSSEREAERKGNSSDSKDLEVGRTHLHLEMTNPDYNAKR